VDGGGAGGGPRPPRAESWGWAAAALNEALQGILIIVSSVVRIPKGLSAIVLLFFGLLSWVTPGGCAAGFPLGNFARPGSSFRV